MSTFRMMMELWGDELSTIEPDEDTKSDEKKDDKGDKKDKPRCSTGSPSGSSGRCSATL